MKRDRIVHPVVPVLMVAMAIGVTFMVPEHSGKELNEIIT